MTHEKPFQMRTKSSPLLRGAAAGPALSFPPERLVAAISFHLIDERISASVSPDSAARTTRRLEQSACLPSMPRAAWARLKNAERLKWLLEQSRTEIALSGGVALLTRRDEK